MQKSEELVGIDLGAKVTKAVCLRRRGDQLTLVNYALAESPSATKALTRDPLGDHLHNVMRALGGPAKRVALAVSPPHALLSQVDLPAASPSDLRKMIKLSPKSYLQQDLPDHLFDCHVGAALPNDSYGGTGRARRRAKILVAGMRRRLVEDLVDAGRSAGVLVEGITSTQVGLANTFRVLLGTAAEQNIALLDIGSAASTICLLMKGDLVLTRVVPLGSERFSEALVPTDRERRSGVTLAESPSSDVAQAQLQKAILLLTRELDTSMGFFASQYEAAVSHVYALGGPARSHFILQMLEAELSVPCEGWNPTSRLQVELPPARARDLEKDGPQLAVAIGAALTVLKPEAISVNLLAEQREVLESRRRDPLRRGYFVAACLVLLTLFWGAFLGWQVWQTSRVVAQYEGRLASLQRTSSTAIHDAKLATELNRTVSALRRHARERYLWAPALSALQFATVENVQFQRLRLDRALVKEPPPGAARTTGPTRRAAATKVAPEKGTLVKEQITLSIQGRNYGDATDIDRLIETIARHPYFKEHLRSEQPVLLKDLQPRQVDPTDARRTFSLFVIDCVYRERVFKYE